MIVVLKPNPNQAQLDNLVDWLKKHDITVHTSNGASQVLLGLVGDTSVLDIDLIKALDIVEDGVNGALVDPESGAKGFADALVRVSRQTFGDLRTPALEKFSFDRMAQSSLAVYRELASPPTSA